MFWVAAAAPSASADVVLNEVNCEGTDWVELVNTSGDPAEISGWLLTDDPLNPATPRADHRMLFPDPTVIDADGDLVVERGAGGFPFGISCGDDTIRLADEAEALVDEIFVPELSDEADTWGRYPDGSGDWLQTLASPGAANEPASGGPGPDLAAWLFDPASVFEIDLGLPQESIDALAVTPDVYQDGTFSLTTPSESFGPLDVGIRLKGSGSFRPLTGKAAFKVKFNHSVAGQRFHGLKTLTLNNMVQDPSMIHELLAHEVFRAAGIPAPRTGNAYVRVNDLDYGLYVNVETPDDVMLSHWQPTTQHLYEGESGDDVDPGGAAGFEVEEGSESDRSDLEALVDAVNAAGGDWSDQVAAVLDLEQATRMWAIEKYMGHWDGYAGGRDPIPNFPNNYFLHSDAGGVFRMLPWGTDQAWVERHDFDRPGGVMFERCLQDASCRALFRAQVIEARSLVAGLDLGGRATAAAALLGPWQQLDPRREYTIEQIEHGVASTLAFLQVRPFDVDDWLAPDPGPGGTPAATPPETTIVLRPKGKTRTRRVKFKFSSSQAGSVFECRLDGRGFAPCGLRETFKVGRGKHRFMVRSTAPNGLTDPSPAEARFEVLEKR